MKKDDICVLKRSVATNYGAGVACGPFGYDAVDVEIVVLDNGQKVYLHGGWCSECPDEFDFNVTAESVYDIYARLSDCSIEEETELIATLDRILEAAESDEFLKDVDVMERYSEQYKEIERTILCEVYEEEGE